MEKVAISQHGFGGLKNKCVKKNLLTICFASGSSFVATIIISSPGIVGPVRDKFPDGTLL
jgi:hypothetical protein